MHGGGMTFGGMRGMAGSPHFAAIGPGPGLSRPGFAAGPRFAGAPFAHGVYGPHFAHFHHGFFHHRFRRFAFVGFPYYADYGYDLCWRRAWTSYGLQWINVCGDYTGY